MGYRHLQYVSSQTMLGRECHAQIQANGHNINSSRRTRNRGWEGKMWPKEYSFLGASTHHGTWQATEVYPVIVRAHKHQNVRTALGSSNLITRMSCKFDRLLTDISANEVYKLSVTSIFEELFFDPSLEVRLCLRMNSISLRDENSGYNLLRG